jgi:antitoxin HicB
MIAYPAIFNRADDGITVTFPDIPEAITCGYSDEQAMEYAVDALESILSEYINRRLPLPRPSQPRGKDTRLVRLPALAEAKLGVYGAMLEQGVRKADLARRLGWQKSLVDRLLDLKHASRLEQIEAALAALDKRLTIHIDAA